MIDVSQMRAGKRTAKALALMALVVGLCLCMEGVSVAGYAPNLKRKQIGENVFWNYDMLPTTSAIYSLKKTNALSVVGLIFGGRSEVDKVKRMLSGMYPDSGFDHHKGYFWMRERAGDPYYVDSDIGVRSQFCTQMVHVYGSQPPRDKFYNRHWGYWVAGTTDAMGQRSCSERNNDHGAGEGVEVAVGRLVKATTDNTIVRFNKITMGNENWPLRLDGRWSWKNNNKATWIRILRANPN